MFIGTISGIPVKRLHVFIYWFRLDPLQLSASAKPTARDSQVP
jgi:hypothetical protein